MSEEDYVHPTYGQVAYNGYRKASGGKSLVSCAPIPPWGEMPEEIREAWEAAAGELVSYYSQLGSS